MIRAINAAAAPVLALDIPSGLLADTGSAPGEVVQAALTVTFIAMKPGLLTARGPAVCGEIVFDALGVEAAACGAAFPRASLIQPAHVAPCVAPRARDAHKGHHGHVCIIGGDHGMGGAVCMSAEAALRIGAGLVSVVTRPEHVAPLLTRCPEVMARGDEGADALARATVIVIGPGLGRSSWSMDWLTRALASGLPIVIDADALNGLPAALSAIGLARLGPSAVLTPHPGEAARLLDTTAAMVQADRFSAADGLVSRWGGTLVLKGPGTLVLAEGVTPALAAVGNPGMASGGMGDVLAGVIGGLMAQGHPAFLAACAGVWLHGRAADIAAFQGERGLRATDLMAPLRSLVNGGRV